MDYNELLFAYHARDLAVRRLGNRAPKGLTDAEDSNFRHANFDAVLTEVVEELQGIAEKIKKSESK
jgi:hypothetical protein